MERKTFMKRRFRRSLRLYPAGNSRRTGRLSRTLGDIEVRTATLDDPDCGLTDEVLDNTDVMMWWGALRAWDRVPDEIARKVADRVLLGMGLIVMHSGHYSQTLPPADGHHLLPALA